ncbi:MAG: hemerythrin domain-containing protein [Anaerolineales bacterium]
MDKNSTEILEEEHRPIQKMADVMLIWAEHLRQGQELHIQSLNDLVEFMRTFADRCHHGKEETYLFPALERSGVPSAGGPLGALRHEHQTGRALVAQLAQAITSYVPGNPATRQPIEEVLRGLVGLYPNHIWKENNMLFPMARKFLSAAEERKLQEAFRQVELEIGPDVHERMESIALRLEAEARLIRGSPQP